MNETGAFFMTLKLATRPETNGIALVYDKTLDGFTAHELDLKERQRGEINLGYHFVLHEDGTLETGIPSFYYARSTLRRWRDCIYVLVTSEKLNSVQKDKLDYLARELNLEVVDNGSSDT